MNDSLSMAIRTLGVAFPDETFIVLPSIEGLGNSDRVWEILRGNAIGEMVPFEVMQKGGLILLLYGLAMARIRLAICKAAVCALYAF